MTCFVLKNAIDDANSVVFKTNSDNNLTEIINVKNIIKIEDGITTNDQVLNIDFLVFMNIWKVTP